MTARAGMIKESGNEILTPTRVLNSTELENGLKLEKCKLVKVDFPHPITEVTHYIKTDSIYSMIKNAEASNGLKNQVEEKSKNAGQRITIFHPVFDKSLKTDDRLNSIMIDLQIQSDIDAVSILDDYNSSPEEFENRIKSSIKQIEDSDSVAEPMPTIRLDSDERIFGRKLKVCVGNRINIINLTYAPIKENYHNYSYLINNMADEDVWLHLSEVGNKIFNKSSLIHAMPLFSIDSFALKSRPFPPGTYKKRISVPKRFDTKTLGQIDVNEHKQMYGDKLNCDCFVDINMDKQRTLNNFLNVFNGAQLLKQALVCHDACSSFNEFLKARNKIIGRNYRNYLRNKKYMHLPVKRFFKIDLGNKTINGNY